VRYEAAEKFGVFGHVAHVILKHSKALLERRKLLEESFFSELLFQETAFAFVVSPDKTHDEIPWYWVGLCMLSWAWYRRRETAARLQPPPGTSNLLITRRPAPV
jgi:hypothetical protein